LFKKQEDISINGSVSKNLIIFSGPIRSGKSSRLYAFFKDWENVAGILSLIIDDKKYLYSIRTKEKKLLEVINNESDNDVITIGKYNFSKEVFAWGRKILSNDLKEKSGLIIIDEIGKLELAGKGLAPTAFEIIKKSSAGSQKVMVVVRETLVKKFLEQIPQKNPRLNSSLLIRSNNFS